MIRKILILLILSSILILPASAFILEAEVFIPLTGIDDNFTYVAPEGKIITDVYYYLDAGESVNGTLYYGNSQIPYEISFSRPNFYTSEIYLRLGNENATISDYDLLGSQKSFLVTYAFDQNENPSTSICLIYEKGDIFKPSLCTPIENLEIQPIWKFSVNPNNPVDLKVGILTYKTYFEGWETTREYGSGNESYIDFVNLISDFSTKSLPVIGGIIWYFNLIFIDNGLLTFALFEVTVLAWSVGTSRDVFSFYRKFIRTHVSLFRFLMDVIKFVADVIYKIVNTLIPF